MTDHPTPNPNVNSEYGGPVDEQLRQAGRHLRDTTADQVDSAAALVQLHDNHQTNSTRGWRQQWRPKLAAAAASVAVLTGGLLVVPQLTGTTEQPNEPSDVVAGQQKNQPAEETLSADSLSAEPTGGTAREADNSSLTDQPQTEQAPPAAADGSGQTTPAQADGPCGTAARPTVTSSSRQLTDQAAATLRQLAAAAADCNTSLLAEYANNHSTDLQPSDTSQQTAHIITDLLSQPGTSTTTTDGTTLFVFPAEATDPNHVGPQLVVDTEGRWKHLHH